MARDEWDALAYLPRKTPIEFRRGAIIYSAGQPANEMHLVVQGAVKVSLRDEHDGRQTLIDIYRTDEFFGEGGLLGMDCRSDSATAMERSLIMTWNSEEIERQIEAEPRLGLALTQMIVARSRDMNARIEALALDKTPERVARGLLRFAERMGEPNGDGSIRIPPLTHQTIAEFVCTSRELVTFNMNRLRQQGYLRYSRKSIEIYAEAVRERLGTRLDSSLRAGNAPGSTASMG